MTGRVSSPAAGDDKHVLILDLDGFYARDLVRCLAAAGYARIEVLGPPGCNSRYSRHASFHLLPGNLTDSRLMTTLEYLRRLTGARVLLAADELAVGFVGRHRRALAMHWRLGPVPEAGALSTAADKARLSRHLRAQRLPQPDTECVADLEQGLVAARRVGYPLLLKPIRSAGNGRGIRRCDDERALREALEWGGTPLPVLVQAFLPGTDEDCSVLCLEGRVLAYTVQRPALSPARPYTAARALHIVHDLEALLVVARLVGSLNYSGVAHVDMRRASADGRLRIIEVNPRFWQTVIASLSAGVNFPELACRLACGEQLTAPDYREITFVPWRLLALAWIGGKPLGLNHPWRLRTGLRYAAADPGGLLGILRERRSGAPKLRAAKLH